MDQYLAFLEIALPEFFKGLLITIQITTVALVLGFLIGFPAALVRRYGGKIPARLLGIYSDVFRGTPVLVQLFIIYYGLPQFGITLSAFLSAYIALGLNSGAYQAEYFRGAIQAISSGQMMAAQSLGMSKWKAIYHIIIPQAFRLAIPAWSNEVVAMVKVTSIVYLTAVPDLMTKAKALISRFYNPIESYLTVAVFYLVLVIILTIAFNALEIRLRIPGLELESERH